MFRSMILISLIYAITAATAQDDLKRITVPKKRIIRGWPIQIEDAPYQVSIINTTTESHICGGSIISANQILTAGHCADTIPQDYKIRSGSTYSNRNGQIHTVEKISLHENFSMAFLGLPWDDIAIMKVDPPFEIDNITRKVVELYSHDDKLDVGQTGLLTGWGVLDDNSTTASEQLQGLLVDILDREVCRSSYWIFGGIAEQQFCATHPDKNRDFCSGDSGGPLVINGRQAGIVSWSLGCASLPGVYTEIGLYRDWIDQHMKD